MAVGRPARIYVRRALARQVRNASALETFLVKAGFAVVEPDCLAPAELMAVFAAAEFVVAPHGAEMANLVFCRPGACVLELMPEDRFRRDYWLLAEKMGLNYGVLPCRGDGDIHVDKTQVRTLVRLLRMM